MGAGEKRSAGIDFCCQDPGMSKPVILIHGRPMRGAFEPGRGACRAVLSRQRMSVGSSVPVFTAAKDKQVSWIPSLNRAVAAAMRDGPQAGLDLTDAILARGNRAGCHPAHSARAELCRRFCGRCSSTFWRSME